MRTLDLRDLDLKPVYRFGSEGFALARLASGENHVALAELAPDGCIAPHRAMSRQLLVVLSGSATVYGEDGRQATIRRGQAVIWDSGELHETRTSAGLVAMIIEGEVAD